MSYFEEESYTDTKFDLKIWKRIFIYMLPLKKYLFIGLFAVVLLATVDVAYPLINRYAIDEIIGKGDLTKLPIFIGMYLVYVVTLASMVFVFIMAAGKIQNQLAYAIRKSAFEKLQELPFSYYDRTPVGWIMARMTSDSRNLSDILSWGLIDLTWGFLMMIGITIAMLIINLKLALITLSVLPLLMYASIYFRKRILKAYRQIRKQNSKITGAFNEGITGAKTTKTLVLEDSNFKDFDRLTFGMKRHSIKAVIFAGLYFPTILFISSISTALVFYYGGMDVAAGIISAGVLYVFVSYVGQFFEPVMQLANILARFQQAQASAERILSLIEQEADIKDTEEVLAHYGTFNHPKKENWEPLYGDVIFDNVTFKYKKGETVLKNFNLDVKRGESVALVGHTGAGKSTIVNLICRFYEPTEGQILVDGRPMNDRSIGWLHDKLGYVLQSPHLFSGTIMENIRYGNLEATDEAVIKAAKMVEADQFVQTFEKGYDTQVGEGGSRLSVGQKQLISFARALVADPKILILDEATSSVDTQTEKALQHAIETVMKGRTTFVIAHRLSTVVKADKILVLEHGNILESGTHETLIRQKGHYYKLYTNQFQTA
ncbi:ABC transporter ATP-binding protein [Liberiplasma polymorphum]|uniref:ABC transporter ATP-binding protein n=1 Tax=Liberiplasma polymorphum TaxID=3374570 RepID=UPI0037727AE9